jgi:hypothetical protein
MIGWEIKAHNIASLFAWAMTTTLTLAIMEPLKHILDASVALGSV